MENIEERLNNIQREEFYFFLFNGIYIPNYKKFIRIFMFNDIFYIENEKQTKQYSEHFYILKIKELILNKIKNIEKMDKYKNRKMENPKGDGHFIHVKLNDEVYSICRGSLNNEEEKEYDSFVREIFDILQINDNNLPELISNYKQDDLKIINKKIKNIEGDKMNNKVLNRQIPLKTVIDIANYFEDYKDEYIRKFEIDKKNNENLPSEEREWKFQNGSAEVKYTISFYSGKIITESDYNWFVGNTNNLREIQQISIHLYISYFESSKKYLSDIYSINASVDFDDHVISTNYSDASISVYTKNKDQEANSIYNEIINLLENNEERYNKTIKHKEIRIQSFAISVGIVLSYILYVVLKINSNELSNIILDVLNNKWILIIGQWFVSIVLGNILAAWYILSIYKPLLPDKKYMGYNMQSGKAMYKDNVEQYKEHSEVHFGKYWDAEKRRSKIEKIYKVTSKIIFIQLLISLIMFLILK